jgi:hypothetical protein
MKLAAPLALLVACAPTTSTTESNIVNGQATNRPWAAFLGITLQNGNQTVCSGALVAPNKVLTAAHCAVCAASIDVTLVGDATPRHASSWAAHPAAFSSPPTCSLSSVDQQLAATVNVGADVAIVTLGSSSGVTPIEALTSPPFGFDPVAQTASVTIVGRGPAAFESDDTSIMREGVANIDAFTASPVATCMPPPTFSPYLQLWNAGAQATILPGDSGGPMIATFNGTQKVIGAASWFCETANAYFAPTFTADTAPFVASQLGAFAPGADADGDHVADLVDNCAGVANPHQEDAEHDGVGDVCDACPQAYDPSQANCNAEAEHALGIAARGDACDPAPCATIEMTWGAVPPSKVPSPVLPCEINGYGFATCHYEMPTGFVVTPVGQVTGTGHVGLRYCRCDGAHDTAAEREASCRSPSQWHCDVDGDRYAPGDPSWRQLSVSGTGSDPLTVLAFGTSTPAAIAWDSLADLAALGSSPLPLPPWTPDADGIVAGDHLDGIAWAHVTDVAGTTTASQGSPVVDLAGSYIAAGHRFRTVYDWHSIPQYAPAWPWTYCAGCDIELPWIVADVSHEFAVGVGPDGARQVPLASGVIAAIARGRTVVAAEPPPLLERANVMRRAIVVDAAGAALSTLVVRGSTMASETRRGGPPPGTDTTRLLVYSALRDELFALQVPADGSQTRLARSLAGHAWTTATVALGTPLAATFRAEESALYVVDRVVTATRLVRIDLVSNRATVVSANLFTTTPRAVALSVNARGELLLAASIASHTELAWIANGRLVGRATARDPLGGDARELAHGVHYATATLEPRVVPISARRAPIAGETLAPLL